MDTDKLISLKQNFTGQRFQWIKPEKPELLSKVVKCRDVAPTPDGKFIIVFDDGSKIDSTKLNSNLLMIHGDMEPLTRSEVESIYGKRPAPAAKIEAQPQAQTQTQQSTQNSTVQSAPVTESTSRAPHENKKSNMFSMFNSEESTLALNINVRLPEKKLLKMMYLNAENKDQFVDELAEYLQSMINKQVVKGSIKAILAPPPPKKEKGVINLTEVDESK